MKFNIKFASDSCYVQREVDIESMEELKNLPERFMSSDSSIGWQPPHSVIVNFEDNEIEIYDYYRE